MGTTHRWVFTAAPVLCEDVTHVADSALLSVCLSLSLTGLWTPVLLRLCQVLAQDLLHLGRGRGAPLVSAASGSASAGSVLEGQVGLLHTWAR